MEVSARIEELYSERAETRSKLYAMYEELDTILKTCKHGKNFLSIKTLTRVRPSFRSDEHGFNYVKHKTKNKDEVIFILTVKRDTKLAGFKTDAFCELRVVSGIVKDLKNKLSLSDGYVQIYKPNDLIKLYSETYSVIEVKFIKQKQNE